MSAALRQTPLHAWHVAHGARMVPFGGWDMPVQYPTGILAEHRATHAGVGLFDISHMGRVEFFGPAAAELLQRTTTNDVAALAAGRAQYSLLCNEAGGTLDDVIVYRLPDRYLVVVNASNRERDVAWWRERAAAWGLDVRLEDRTLDVAMIAVQGPAAEALLQPLTAIPLTTFRYYTIAAGDVAGRPLLLSRTGYTGEDGFELMVASDRAVALWEDLLACGAGIQPTPVGLGARDTLRLEAGMPLYGHELSEAVTPLEAGLGRVVKLDKGEFVGRTALAARAAEGPARRLAGFAMEEAAIPRQGYAVLAHGQPVGEVTSGGFGPSVERGIGLAYLPPTLAAEATELSIAVRERSVAARVCKLPFWPHRTKRIPSVTEVR